MDNFELSQCPNCHCMTKTIPKGLGRSYGYGYRCGKCGAPKMKREMKKKRYNEEHDCFYNEKKDEWAEKKCDDINCEFCKDRPSKPSEVKE